MPERTVEEAEALLKRWNRAAGKLWAGSEFIDNPEQVFRFVSDSDRVKMDALLTERRFAGFLKDYIANLTDLVRMIVQDPDLIQTKKTRTKLDLLTVRPLDNLFDNLMTQAVALRRS